MERKQQPGSAMMTVALYFCLEIQYMLRRLVTNTTRARVQRSRPSKPRQGLPSVPVMLSHINHNNLDDNS